MSFLKKTKSAFLCILLGICLTLTAVPLPASADDPVMMASDITADQFVAAVAKVQETARKRKYVYGDSRSAVPTADKKISCDRLIAKALYDLGFHDQETGGITVGSMPAYLKAHGFVESTKFTDIGYGSIVLIMHKTVNYFSHAFVTLSFDASTKTFDKYDTGSNSLINSVQPVRGCSWPSTWRTSPIRVYNLPAYNPSASASGTSKTAKQVADAVKLDLDESIMVTGQTFTLSAQITPESSEGKTLVWTSSDSAVATVDNSGNVTTLSPGEVEIKAAIAKSKAEAVCKLTVLEIPITKLKLKKKSITIGVGTTASVKATVSPKDATYPKVTWTSLNPKIASVSEGGTITGLKAGKAKITAQAGSKTATLKVTVKSYPVTSVTLSKQKLTMKTGQRKTLKVKITPSNATNKKIKWKSSNRKTVTVDRNGTITALKKGTAVIKAVSADGKKKASCTVTVR